MSSTVTTPTRRVPSTTLIGVGLVLTGQLSVHSGAAVATLLFPRAGVSAVVTLRLTLAAIVLVILCRPNVRGYSRGDWALIIGFGAVLAAMNSIYYRAIELIPIGPSVTLEVLGPLTLSVIAARRRASSWLWALLALAGVSLLGRGGFHGLNLTGVVLSLIAGTLWAGYIVLSARTGSRFPKTDGLALALCVAAALTMPIDIASTGRAVLNPAILGLAATVATLSTVLPYSLELFALRRLPTGTFAVLMSLGPVIAATTAFAIAGQTLTVAQGWAMVLIVAASVGAVLAGSTKDARSVDLAAVDREPARPLTVVG